MTYNSENKFGNILTDLKIKNPLFNILFYSMYFHYSLILKNNNIIDTYKYSSIIQYSKESIKKYDEMIEKYRLEKKSTSFLISERDKLVDIALEYEKELMNILKNNLSNTKEIIFDNNGKKTHLILNNKQLHNLNGPSTYSDTINEYYINNEYLTEEEWNKHPLVRSHKINRLIKKTKFKNK